MSNPFNDDAKIEYLKLEGLRQGKHRLPDQDLSTKIVCPTNPTNDDEFHLYTNVVQDSVDRRLNIQYTTERENELRLAWEHICDKNPLMALKYKSWSETDSRRRDEIKI